MQPNMMMGYQQRPPQLQAHSALRQNGMNIMGGGGAGVGGPVGGDFSRNNGSFPIMPMYNYQSAPMM